jgi:hypothetical protein
LSGINPRLPRGQAAFSTFCTVPKLQPHALRAQLSDPIAPEHQAWASELFPGGLGARQTGLGPLADQFALELGEGRQDVEQELGRGVDVGVDSTGGRVQTGCGIAYPPTLLISTIAIR